jgi:hypothetical protein
VTEADLMGLLRARLGQEGGNGPAPAHALVQQVRNAAGFDARRTLDAISMGLWPSRGLMLHGYELKCSRSDWVRELKDPAKAEQFLPMLDFFWIVTSKDVVREDELPENWGLLVAQKTGLVQKVPAGALRDLTPVARKRPLPPGMDRSFLASLLRAAVRQHDATPDDVVKEATAEKQARYRREDHDALREQVREFEQASGVSFARWSVDGNPQQIGSALKSVLEGRRESDRLKRRLEGVRDSAQGAADAAKRELEKLGSPETP